MLPIGTDEVVPIAKGNGTLARPRSEVPPLVFMEKSICYRKVLTFYMSLLLQTKSREIILVLFLTHSEYMFPHILTMLRMLDPLAGSPQLLQSGPITAREFTFKFVATQRDSLREAGGFRECCYNGHI